MGISRCRALGGCAGMRLGRANAGSKADWIWMDYLFKPLELNVHRIDVLRS